MAKHKKRKKEKRKKDKNKVVKVNTDLVTCSVCGYVGDKNEIVIWQSNWEDTNWYAKQRDPSGHPELVEPVCEPCAHKAEDHLPKLADAIKAEIQYAKQFIEQYQRLAVFTWIYGIVPDEKRVCKYCGRQHGQVYVVKSFSNLYLRLTLVDFIEGDHDTWKEAMADAVCLDCESKIHDWKYRFDKSKEVFAAREQKAARYYRQPRVPKKPTENAPDFTYQTRFKPPRLHKGGAVEKTGT